MNLETKIIIYKFTPQVFTLTQNTRQCHTRGEHQLYAIAVKTKNLRKFSCGGSL
jgi:hypothetical protein